MGFSAAGARIWPVMPEWGRGVQESLAWATDILQANATATTQHRALRPAPRRKFSFEVMTGPKERRVADMLLAGHSGIWQLPIFPDVQWLQALVPSASEEVLCATAGFDFVAGGRALLYTAVNRFELVDIATVESDRITLVAPTVATYSRGSRLYPVRRARVQDAAEERLSHHDAGRRRLAFDIDEPCDWPVLSSPTEYLGHLVLDARPDESSDPTSSYSRLVQTVDYDTGLPVVHDLAGVALRAQKNDWKLFGRVQHTWFRSLLYTLTGRQTPIWVPSWNRDLLPAAAIAGGGTSLSVEWAGYTLFGKDKPNRKDVCIELNDGAVFYRRITDAVEAGETETLTLNASLDAGSIAPGRVRQVSFMALCTLGSDEIEIDHVTDADGTATSTTGWQAVVPDV